MIMQLRKLRTAALVIATAVLHLALAAIPARAQWVPPRGEASLSLEYQRFSTSKDLVDELTRIRRSDVFNDQAAPTVVEGHIAVLSVDYGLMDRLGLNVSLPFVNSAFKSSPFGAYTGPHSSDNEPNNAFQDLGVTFTHLTLTDPVLVTTSLGATWPLTDYTTHGHAAIGRKLKYLRAGAGVARRLDPVLPDLLLQVNYTFSYSEKVAEFRPNRSTGFASLTYFTPLPALTLSAFYNHEITHGGLKWGEPRFRLNRREYWPIHDQVVDERFAQLGGVASYAVNDQLGVYLGGFTTIEGWSAFTQKVEGLSFGTTTNF